MRLRSFHGQNLNDAMRQVREALGMNAVIVATRDDDMGGVRVTAAVEDTPVDTSAPLSASAPSTPAPPPFPPPSLPPPVDTGDVAELVADCLMRHGLPMMLSEKMMDVVTHFSDHDALIALGAAMDRFFRFAPLFDDPPRPVCLVGSPGAGKTLAMAKIAAQRALNRKSVGVITTDMTRPGAVEELAAYTRIMKLRLFEVEDANGLKDALESHPPGEVVLVDSSGRNPFHAGEMKTLGGLLELGVEPVLVMPAGLDVQEACDQVRAFADLGVKKLIISKIDLARRLGSLLAMLRETRIAVSDMSLSPKVTDPLQPANAVTFARLFLPPEIVARALKHRATA